MGKSKSANIRGNIMTQTEETKITDDNRPEYLKKRVLVPSITAVIFLICGVFYAIHSIYYKTTDDAFIEGHIVSISPRISGPVVKLLVEDNQEINKGDLLLEIDASDYEVKIKQKEAQLEEAKAMLKSAQNKINKSQADLSSSEHEITKDKSELDFASEDFNRYSLMYKKGISSKQDYDASSNKLTAAKSNYSSSLDKNKSVKSVYETSKSEYEEVQASIKRLEAELEQDKLNLSYTKIYAPQAGLVTNRNVEEGNYVQIAQPLMSIVPKEMWIVANFKETQIADMKKGQPVKIKLDTYRGKVFKGEVDSIQRSTGAKSSLFPPENAVGSYVKIVQRVPVKIVFKEDISKYNIVPGMSVVPEVKVK